MLWKHLVQIDGCLKFLKAKKGRERGKNHIIGIKSVEIDLQKSEKPTNYVQSKPCSTEKFADSVVIMQHE